MPTRIPKDQKAHYIIDFDSTFTQVEALDELVKISRASDPDKNHIAYEIKVLTDRAMDGTLSFQESLEKRIRLLKANTSHVKSLIKILKTRVSTSFARNKAFFKVNAASVYIVSGGFKEFILPVVLPYHILEKNVYANTFELDKEGNITGLDTQNPLSKEGGKVLLLNQWKLEGDIYGIGDGHSDYQLKESGLIKKFFAFTENIAREPVIKKADHIVPSFDEFLYINRLPRAISYPKNRILSLFVGSFSPILTDVFRKDGLSVRLKTTFEDKYHKDVGLLVLDGTQAISNESLRKAAKLKVVGILSNKSRPLISDEICTEMGIVVFRVSKSLVKVQDEELVLRRMVDYINKGSTFGSVNFPNLSMPNQKGVHRLLHIHHNLPGVIAKINQVMASHSLNIEGQFLRTNAKLGYVITDVNSKYDQSVLNDLKQIEHTIKFRVLY